MLLYDNRAGVPDPDYPEKYYFEKAQDHSYLRSLRCVFRVFSAVPKAGLRPCDPDTSVFFVGLHLMFNPVY